MIQKISSFWLITIAFVLIKLTIHFLTSTIYELHRDEMLYFAQGLHLGFGYISTPPFIGFLASVVHTIFGYSEFGIKLFPALTGAASLVVIALFIKEIGGRNLALIIACTGFMASGAFLRSNSLFMPVSFDQFFWFLSSYLVFRMVNRNDPRLWIWIGLVFGLGFLNKYSILFFVFAIITALLISEHRRLLLSKFFFQGMLTGFIIISPNLVWQHDHNWPVVHHMILLQQTQLVNVSSIGFLADQLLMCIPAVFIWLSGLFVVLVVKKEKKYRFVSITFLFVILIILLARGKSYYTLGAYPMLMVAGGYVLEKYFRNKLIYINYFILVFAIGISLAVLPLELPIASFETLKRYCDPQTGIVPQRWEDGEIHTIPQDYADMTGWKELNGLVAKAFNTLNETEKKQCTIYAENYGQAGAVEFYGHHYGLPSPVSFNDSYLLWAPDSISDGPFISINDHFGVANFFNNCQEIGRVNNEYFREDGVKVILCTNPGEYWKNAYAHRVHMLKNSLHNLDRCKNTKALTVPVTIQAEDCCNSFGVETEMTSDSTGGSNVGWIDNGDWMEYKIIVPENETYSLELRVANLADDGSVTIGYDDVSGCTVNIPETGGWQVWTTVNAKLFIPTGTRTIRFTSIKGGWNINWFRISLERTI